MKNQTKTVFFSINKKGDLLLGRLFDLLIIDYLFAISITLKIATWPSTIKRTM